MRNLARRDTVMTLWSYFCVKGSALPLSSRRLYNFDLNRTIALGRESMIIEDFQTCDFFKSHITSWVLICGSYIALGRNPYGCSVHKYTYIVY